MDHQPHLQIDVRHALHPYSIQHTAYIHHHLLFMKQKDKAMLYVTMLLKIKSEHLNSPNWNETFSKYK